MGELYNTGFFGLGTEIPSWFPALVFIAAVWSLFWKGLALWHAARHKQPWWFLIMLLVNTVGILEVVYLFGVRKLKFQDLFDKTK